MAGRLRTPQLIGRERPLRDLFDALDEVGSTGAVVLLGGEAGIGKTRLLDEFASRADEARVVRGGCVEGVAYAPWTDALWWLLSGPDPVPLGELPEGVRGEVARLLPELGPVSSDRGDEEGGQHRLFEAVVSLLSFVAKDSKVVLVVDDVHWIDPASRELLRYVATNLRRLAILLVIAYRPEDSAGDRQLLAQLGRLGRYRLVLERLPADQTSEMARYLLGDDASGADVDRIAQSADGNPLFVEELVAALGDEGLPHTVRDLMLVRFDSLDDDARHLVRAAALIGPRAPRAWLAGAAELGEEQTHTAARAALDIGVLLAEDDSYAFRHALLRQAILDDLAPDERVVIHRAIAVALTGHPERAVGVDHVEELARHWSAAGDAPVALHWVVVAAQQAVARYAYEAATDLYDRGLDLWDTVPDAEAVAGVDHAALLLSAADAAGMAGQVDRAADLAAAAVHEASELNPSRGVDAAARAYPMLWTADRAAELFELASARLVPLLDDVEPHARARFLVSALEHALDSGSPSDMREAANRMMAVVAQVEDDPLQARARYVMAQYYERSGQFDLAEQEFAEAARIARGASDHSTLALVLYNHASMYLTVPDYDKCVNVLDEVDDIVKRYGILRFAVPACGLRALAAALGGDLTAAEQALSSIDEMALEGFEACMRAWAQAVASVHRGAYDSAIAAIDPANVGLTPSVGSEFGIQHAMMRAEALAWKRELLAARTVVDEGFAGIKLGRSDAYCYGELAIVALRIEADIAVAAGKQLDTVENAQERAQSILDGWHQARADVPPDHPLVITYSRACEAEMARLRAERVVEAAMEAASAFDDVKMPYYATYFRLRAAETALADNDRLTGFPLIERVRADARHYGFGGLDAAVTTIARSHQIRIGPGRKTIDGDEPLSARELEVLRLIVDGKTNPDIAAALHVSVHTARAHVSNLLRKLDSSSRAEAASEAVRRGLV